MTRAATAPELVKFASDGQWSDVLAIIPTCATVLACRVNGSFAYDKLSQFNYDGVTAGSYSAVLPGMTVMFGSAAGLYDHGMSYIRKSATAAVIYIGKSSEIAIADNDYVTVLQEFGPWAKVATQAADGAIAIDHDEVYSAQMATRKPIVIAGGDRVLELTGASVAALYALSGATSYVTTCAGATVSNGTTDHPTVTITAAGDYLVKIVGTLAGVTSTTYRWIYVTTAAAPGKNIILSGNNADAAGWPASITLYENQSSVRDRAKVVLYARDYYAHVLGSIGSLAGCENITTIGYIVGKTITIDPDSGAVSFDIRHAGYFLDQAQAVGEVVLNQVSGTPSSWSEIQSLTVDKMLWHLTTNYSTLLNFADLILTGDTRTSVSMTAPIGSVWGQINGVADGYIKAGAFVNQYGQVVVSIDTPLIPIASRASIPVVVTLTADDFESIDVDAVQVQPTAQVIVTGQLADGTTVASIGGGRVPDRLGNLSSYDGLLAANQAEMNVLAGSLFSRDNTPYKFSISNLRGNNRLIEPGDRIGLTLAATDNPSGLAYSGYAIVRTIDRTHDPKTGGWLINLDADAETQAVRYCTGDLQMVLDENYPDDFTDFGFPKLPPFDGGFGVLEPPLPPDVWADTCTDASPETGPYYLVWDKAHLDGANPNVDARTATTWKRCTIRASTADNPTSFTFLMNSKGAPYDHLHCYGISSAGDILATGTVATFGQTLTTVTVTFSEASPVEVSGFRLVLDEGVDYDNATAPLYTPDADPQGTAFGNGLEDGGWGGVTGWANARTVYDTYMTEYTFAANGQAFNLNLRGTTDVGGSGETWLWLNIVANAGCWFRTSFWGDGSPSAAGYGSILGWFRVKLDDVPQAWTRIAIGNPGETNSFSGVARLYYTGVVSTPQRNASLRTGELYNVCPGVTA